MGRIKFDGASMSKTKIFIDGKEGTTGLQIFERIGARPELELITLPQELRKDPAARREALNAADIAFLCLPDAAAIEAVALVENPNTVIIDASTAHRTAPGWCYGFPELTPGGDARVAAAKRIAVPGCHASGAIALLAPLIREGLLPKETPIAFHSLTGYSGGGKKMIATYEDEARDPLLAAPRQYGLTQTHKHLKEIQFVTGLADAPLFCPIVDDYYSGMQVTVPLFAKQLTDGATADTVKALYRSLYRGPILSYQESLTEDGFLSAGLLSGKDSMRVTVLGNGERLLLIAVYDNLGKGASGAAVECMNLVLGAEKTMGLNL